MPNREFTWLAMPRAWHHDVIFEELAPTCTVPPHEGENDKLLLQPIKETVPIKNPIENPQAHPDLWDQLQIPVQVTQNQIQITNPDPPPCQIPVHDHPDRPTHIPKPMRAMQESTEYLRCKENAQACGKNWAHNGDVPLVEDEDDVEDIIAMKASEIMNIVDRKDMWVPDNYEQALTKLNIWMPAMDVEIHCMEEWDVWQVVPCKPWMKVIDNQWVFDNKIDRDTRDLLKHRAHLVIKGFTQIQGLHYYDSFAAVVWYCYDLFLFLI